MAFDNSTAALARDLGEQAERDEAAAFDSQHALRREAERAATSIIATGQERMREAEAERERRAEQARRAADGPDRFDTQDDIDDDAEFRRGPARRARTAPPASHQRPAPPEEDEEDEVPSRWLT